MKTKVLQGIWEFTKTVVFVVAFFYLIRVFIVQPFIIQGASMEPILHNNQYILVERWTRLFKEFKRGDIVVFQPSLESHDELIKRVIGLPGETVRIEDNKIIIKNRDRSRGFVLQERYLQNGTKTLIGDSPLEKKEINLGENQFFVLGDNRGASKDSRIFGPIEKKQVVGRAWRVVFPIKDFSPIARPRYTISIISSLF